MDRQVLILQFAQDVKNQGKTLLLSGKLFTSLCLHIDAERPYDFMSAGVKYYEAGVERKFSIIFVIQNSLQYLLPAQNVEV